MRFKLRSSDTVQCTDFLKNDFVQNSVRQNKEFKISFPCQNPTNLIPARKFYPNLKLYPFLKHILSVFNFSWLIGCALSVDDKIIGFKGMHVDKIII